MMTYSNQEAVIVLVSTVYFLKKALEPDFHMSTFSITGELFNCPRNVETGRIGC